MATTFDRVIDMALLSVKDYKLDELAQTSYSDFQAITEGFLLRGLPEFSTCRQPLTYDTTARTFSSDLTDMEVSILADLWVEEWMRQQVNNVTQFKLKMTTTDFKHYSEAENLKQKAEWLDRIREKVKQKMTDYDLQDLTMFQNYANGIFFT